MSNHLSELDKLRLVHENKGMDNGIKEFCLRFLKLTEKEQERLLLALKDIEQNMRNNMLLSANSHLNTQERN